MRSDPGRSCRLAAGHRPPDSAYDADIIILALNRFAETVDAVSSARRQTGIRFHISVLDQGSDATVRAKFAETFNDAENLGYFIGAGNLGVPGGRNLLSSLGTGRIIIALDNDAVFANALVAAKAIAAFDAKPRLAALGFRILARDGVHLDEFSWGYPNRLKPRSAENFDTTTFVGAGHAIRRQAWNEVGGYDESLFFTWEEYDFCLTAISLHWLIHYDGSLCVIHKISQEERISWSSARAGYFVRNRLIIYRKWGTPWVNLMPRMFGYAFKGLRSGCLGAVLGGMTQAMRASPPYPKRQMSPGMADYLSRNEHRHRGTLFSRLRFELLKKINVDG